MGSYRGIPALPVATLSDLNSFDTAIQLILILLCQVRPPLHCIAIVTPEEMRRGDRQHVDGTDGSDFMFRQTIESRYATIAAARKKLKFVLTIQLVHFIAMIVLRGVDCTRPDSPRSLPELFAVVYIVLTVLTVVSGWAGLARDKPAVLSTYRRVNVPLLALCCVPTLLQFYKLTAFTCRHFPFLLNPTCCILVRAPQFRLRLCFSILAY